MPRNGDCTCDTCSFKKLKETESSLLPDQPLPYLSPFAPSLATPILQYLPVGTRYEEGQWYPSRLCGHQDSTRVSSLADSSGTLWQAFPHFRFQGYHNEGTDLKFKSVGLAYDHVGVPRILSVHTLAARAGTLQDSICGDRSKTILPSERLNQTTDNPLPVITAYEHNSNIPGVVTVGVDNLSSSEVEARVAGDVTVASVPRVSTRGSVEQSWSSAILWNRKKGYTGDGPSDCALAVESNTSEECRKAGSSTEETKCGSKGEELYKSPEKNKIGKASSSERRSHDRVDAINGVARKEEKTEACSKDGSYNKHLKTFNLSSSTKCENSLALNGTIENTTPQRRLERKKSLGKKTSFPKTLLMVNENAEHYLQVAKGAHRKEKDGGCDERPPQNSDRAIGKHFEDQNPSFCPSPERSLHVQSKEGIMLNKDDELFNLETVMDARRKEKDGPCQEKLPQNSGTKKEEHSLDQRDTVCLSFDQSLLVQSKEGDLLKGENKLFQRKNLHNAAQDNDSIVKVEELRTACTDNEGVKSESSVDTNKTVLQAKEGMSRGLYRMNLFEKLERRKRQESKSDESSTNIAMNSDSRNAQPLNVLPDESTGEVLVGKRRTPPPSVSQELGFTNYDKESESPFCSLSGVPKGSEFQTNLNHTLTKVSQHAGLSFDDSSNKRCFHVIKSAKGKKRNCEESIPVQEQPCKRRCKTPPRKVEPLIKHEATDELAAVELMETTVTDDPLQEDCHGNNEEEVQVLLNNCKSNCEQTMDSCKSHEATRGSKNADSYWRHPISTPPTAYREEDDVYISRKLQLRESKIHQLMSKRDLLLQKVEKMDRKDHVRNI